MIHDCWASFRFAPTFRQRHRDIAWAEAIAVELLLHAIQFFPITYHRLLLFCDNSVVADRWRIGHSRNVFVNHVFRRIATFLKNHHWQLQIKYIASADNPADAPSRGLKPDGPHLPLFKLPPDLKYDIQRDLHPNPLASHTQLRSIHTEQLPGTVEHLYHPSTGQPDYFD